MKPVARDGIAGDVELHGQQPRAFEVVGNDFGKRWHRPELEQLGQPLFECGRIAHLCGKEYRAPLINLQPTPTATGPETRRQGRKGFFDSLQVG